MKISYKKLWHLLIERNMNKGDLQRLAGISSTSIAKLSKGENLQTEVLVKICVALNCDTSDIMEFERDNSDSERSRQNRRHLMKIVSLFSGAGGLDLGLIQDGNQIIWANDIDKDAVATYTKNIGKHIVCADIKNIDIADIPLSDVIVGGFPCQGFSQANLLRTVADERNQLYKFFLGAVKEKQPRFFIAENVRGILSLGKGDAIKQIVSDFETAGYAVTVTLVNMAYYGIPQTRQRVFIIGQHRDLREKMLFKLPEKTNGKGGIPSPWVSIKSALDHYPDPDKPNEFLNHIYSAY